MNQTIPTEPMADRDAHRVSMPVHIVYAFPPDIPPYVEGGTMTIVCRDGSTVNGTYDWSDAMTDGYMRVTYLQEGMPYGNTEEGYRRWLKKRTVTTATIAPDCEITAGVIVKNEPRDITNA